MTENRPPPTTGAKTPTPRWLRPAAVLLAAALAFPCLADEIILKDGRIVQLANVHISDTSILSEVKIGNSTGQLGYVFNTIAKIQMPKPPQLQAATDLLGLGKPEQVIPLLAPVLAFYGPLKDIPGNWWVPGALLTTTALEDLGRENEAEPLLNDLARLATDPESARIAKVRLAAITAHKGNNQQAQAVFDSVLDESSDSGVLAETWMDKAESLMATKSYEPALLAFLHIPVFYPDQRLLMPRALLGSARAYKNLEEFQKARDSLDQLTADYGGSPESAAAKAEMAEVLTLEKKKKPAPN